MVFGYRGVDFMNIWSLVGYWIVVGLEEVNGVRKGRL